jgi:hypothetical protein
MVQSGRRVRYAPPGSSLEWPLLISPVIFPILMAFGRGICSDVHRARTVRIHHAEDTHYPPRRQPVDDQVHRPLLVGSRHLTAPLLHRFVVVELVEGADMQAAKTSGGACQSCFKLHPGGAHQL